MFLFENDQNQKLFCQQPKIYLNTPPTMPDSFRLLLFVPTGSGKKSVANILHENTDGRLLTGTKLWFAR